jgi:hypothetical protein
VKCWQKGYDLVQNGRCIWIDKRLDVTQDEAINMTLEDWKQLERGDIDVQYYFSFEAECVGRE